MCSSVKVIISTIFWSFMFCLFYPFTIAKMCSDVDEKNMFLNTSKKDDPKLKCALPNALIPLHYTLELQPFLPPNGNFSFAGNAKILMRCRNPTFSITLHGLNLEIFVPTVNVINNTDRSSIPVTRVEYDKEKQFFVIHLNRKLRAKDEYIVSMKYLGWLSVSTHGFYLSSCTDGKDATTTWLAVTQFQPTDARRAFPCFDEPDFKAKFDITLIRPSNMSSISNMPIARTEDRENDLKADIYDTTLSMSTYLLAFVVSNFSFRAQNATHTQFRVWARPAALEQVDYALMAGPKTLDFFELYFNVSFPLPKLDMIAVPDFRSGAMENWGLITYRETALLFDKKISSSANKQRVLSVIAHELAHQWFGNLVTPKYWDGLWLNEGFATYMEYVGSHHVEPTWKVFDQFLPLVIMSVFELDCLESSHPVYVPVNYPDEINAIFDRISYEKNYLTKLSYMNAMQDDLWHYLSEASKADLTNINVKDVMDTWTLQTGYPVVKIERDYEKQTATIKQKRFLISTKECNNSNHVSHAEKWTIPITYTTSVAKDFNSTAPKLWFHKSNESITLSNSDGIPSSNDWVIFNIQETAYYRANYDEKNWALLNNQLKRNHKIIDVTGRAQIIDDALDLARARELSYSIALNLTTYLLKEIEYLPWVTALDNFAFIDKMLMYTPAYGNWQRYNLKLVNPAYTKIGFEDLTTNTHLERLNRIKLTEWACKMGSKDCLKKSAELYSEWMQNPSSDPISPNVKSVVACYAIYVGGEAEWQFTFERYLKSNVGTEKDMFLTALACTREPWLLRKYLLLSIDKNSGIRMTDSIHVFNKVADNPIGGFLAFDFLREQWERIIEIHCIGFVGISEMIKSVSTSLNTPFQLKKLKEFVAVHIKYLGKATRPLQQAIEATQANVMWTKYSYLDVSWWLQQQEKPI